MTLTQPLVAPQCQLCSCCGASHEAASPRPHLLHLLCRWPAGRVRLRRLLCLKVCPARPGRGAGDGVEAIQCWRQPLLPARHEHAHVRAREQGEALGVPPNLWQSRDATAWYGALAMLLPHILTRFWFHAHATEVAARATWDGIRSNKFFISHSFDGVLLNWLTAGAAPVRTLGGVIGEVGGEADC